MSNHNDEQEWDKDTGLENSEEKKKKKKNKDNVQDRRGQWGIEQDKTRIGGCGRL